MDQLLRFRCPLYDDNVDPLGNVLEKGPKGRDADTSSDQSHPWLRASRLGEGSVWPLYGDPGAGT